MTGPLYSKLGLSGVKLINKEDNLQIEKIKEVVKTIQDLKLPLHTEYLIIKSDSCEKGWGAVLKTRPHKYSSRIEEQISRYSSG